MTPIAKGILGVVAVAGIISMVAVVPGVTYALAPFLKKRKYQPKQVIVRNIDSLIKRGLLKKVVQKNGTVSVTLTRKGKWEAGIRGYFRKERDQTSKSWDGIWRIVVFDVPESKRKIRGELRRAVQLYGFKQLQKSVWVYPYPCDSFVELIKGHLGIGRDVLYLTANYLENDKHLKRDFGLSS